MIRGSGGEETHATRSRQGLEQGKRYSLCVFSLLLISFWGSLCSSSPCVSFAWGSKPLALFSSGDAVEMSLSLDAILPGERGGRALCSSNPSVRFPALAQAAAQTRP